MSKKFTGLLLMAVSLFGAVVALYAFLASKATYHLVDEIIHEPSDTFLTPYYLSVHVFTLSLLAFLVGLFSFGRTVALSPVRCAAPADANVARMLQIWRWGCLFALALLPGSAIRCLVRLIGNQYVIDRTVGVIANETQRLVLWHLSSAIFVIVSGILMGLACARFLNMRGVSAGAPTWCFLSILNFALYHLFFFMTPSVFLSLSQMSGRHVILLKLLLIPAVCAVLSFASSVPQSYYLRNFLPRPILWSLALAGASFLNCAFLDQYLSGLRNMLDSVSIFSHLFGYLLSSPIQFLLVLRDLIDPIIYGFFSGVLLAFVTPDVSRRDRPHKEP